MRESRMRDLLTAAVLFVLVILLGLGLLDRGHEWGDDFAAYMLEARAIANGTMEEQSRINRIIHASEISFGGEEIPEKITYVWGYPLALSGIYRSIGFDTAENGIPIAYKVPGLVMHGILAVVLYLFYRRRFSYVTTIFLTALLTFDSMILDYANELSTDVPCMMLSMAGLLLTELFLDENHRKRQVLTGILMGAVLWYNYEVRLNGVAVIYVVLVAHAISILSRRPAREEWGVHAVPYAVLLTLLGVSAMVLPQATENTSHIASGPNSYILFNIRWYDGQIAGWLKNMLPAFLPGREYARFVLYALIVCGILHAGTVNCLHLSMLMLGTFAVVCLLPYVQSIRYLFNALPLMLMFAMYGVQGIWQRIGKGCSSLAARIVRLGGYAVMLTMICSVLLQTVHLIEAHKQRGGMEYRYEAYSDEALDIYAYIRENTADDAMIGCVKPRALTLNTDRIGFVPGVNGNRYKDMHYLLSFTDPAVFDSVTQSVWPELWNELTEVYRNDRFVLYEMSEQYRLSE